jgi:guanine deaminase
MDAQVEAWMSRAITLALENVRGGAGGPFAALVVRDGQLLAEGVNRVTSANDPTAHAEIVAIREACRRLGSFQLEGCDIYATSEPCPMCLGAIYWAHASRVYYAATAQDAAEAGFDDSLIYREVSLAPAVRRIPMAALMRDRSLEIFREWLRKPDRIPY